jgi:RNA-directed DNA polymerase
MQVLQSRWDGTFFENSYGFRPERSAHQAVEQAQRHIAAGYDWVVDIDLEKFFDRVNHHRLMDTIAQRVGDKRLLKLMRAWLNAGVLENGLVSPTTEGTPQGGPLSPLLSNLVLDELDRELARRGHRFVRYADDCNIYVRSRFVARPRERKFLGFSFTSGTTPKRRLAPKTVLRFKHRVRELTRRTRGISLEQMVKELSGYLQGWHGYFGFCQTPSVLNKLEEWMRHRLRATAWKLWKRSRVRFRELQRRDVNRELIQQTVGSSSGPWRLSNSPAMSLALPIAYFAALGLPRLTACT